MKTSLLILFAFVSVACFSQVKYEPAYFIKNDGVTVKCFIRNAGWENNPREFYYKESENAEAVKTGIDQVKEFGIETGVKYKRFTANIDTSSVDLQDMDKNPQPEYKMQQVFLKVLLEGKATLYEYKGDGQWKFFYGADDNSAEPLIYKKYKNSETSYGENALFRSQLMQQFSCTDMSLSDLESLQYTAKSLVKYFTRYNKCQQAPSVVYNTGVKGKAFHLSVRPGIDLSSIEMKMATGITGATKFKTKPSLRLGLEAEFILPFNQNKWSIILEPVFEYYKSGRPATGVKAFADLKTFSFALGLRYAFFLPDQSKLFINAAYAYGFSQGESLIANNGFKADLGAAGGAVFGVGYARKRLTAEARYQLPRNVLDQYVNWRADHQALALIVGFRLF